MKITVLGSGTSSGVPFISCTCAVCTSTNPKNKRLRSSCLFTVNDRNILIDTSPDLRQQSLDNKITKIDAVIYTHTHADHLHGIDDLRTFNILHQVPIPMYADPDSMRVITSRFPYIFNRHLNTASSSPELIPHEITGDFELFDIPVQIIKLHHGKIDNIGIRIGNVAWLTDTNGIYEGEYEKLSGLDVLFIDALRKKPHMSHFHLERTLEEIVKIAAKRSVLIHLTHDYDHDVFNKQLPDGVELAYDGMVVNSY